MDLQTGIVIRGGIGRGNYRVCERIGGWGKDMRNPVYGCVRKAKAHFPVKAPHGFALKIVSKSQDYLLYKKVKSEINDEDDYFQLGKYILRSETNFKTQVQNEKIRCVGIPLDGKASIRSLMVNGFSAGMPLRCVAFVLDESLKALKDIHNYDSFHGGLTAGTVYLNRGVNSGVQVAYGATYYEQDIIVGNDDFLPINQLVNWGRSDFDFNEALQDSDVDEDGFLVTQRFEKTQDFWLLGLLGLELAYGKIQVKHRLEFLRIIDYIRSHSGLPNMWNQLRYTANTNPDRILSNPRLSLNFIGFLQSCFASTVSERPSLDSLTKHEFILEETPSLEFFLKTVAANLH